MTDAALSSQTAMQQAVQAFLPGAAGFAAIPGHADIVRVTTPEGDWRVRRWPPETPDSDVTFSHEVLGIARRILPDLAPRLLLTAHDTPADAVRIDGRLYDAQQWLPGAPENGADIAWPTRESRIDVPHAIPHDAFTEVIASLGKLHAASEGLATTKGAPSAALGLLPGAVEAAQRRQVNALRSRARFEPAIQRWLATGERLLTAATPLIEQAAEQGKLSTTVLHLGMWPAHVLVQNGSVSGLLGWERAAVGSPLLDLAQATLRLRGWTDDAVETTVGYYTDIRNLTPEERRLFPAVAALDVVATTGRLLEQTFLTGSDERPPLPLRSAVEMMIRSMNAVERSLLGPVERKKRVWDYNWPSRRPRGGSLHDRHR
ncbi:MAG: phosphotransferase [Thermomicrobiales bacterium]|nr:phosphotransferase [Thermomicrobiales bacterium]